MSRPPVGTLIPLWKKGGGSGYHRPADWLELPKLTEGEQKVVGLYAVFPHDSNFVAFTCQGAYTVDWGDGTSNNYNNLETAYHIYEYNSLNSSTYCSRGYRQAIVTITPQQGQNLTSLIFSQKHNRAGLQQYATGWLDVRAVGQSIYKISFGETPLGARNSSLEIFEFVGANNITNFSYMFYSCAALQTIPQLDTSKGVNFSYMFALCSALQTIPLFDTSKGVTFNYMFNSCYALQTIPPLNTSLGINFSNMFGSCYALQTIPQLDTSRATSVSAMFGSCFSLSTATLIGTSIAISYQNCRLSRQALIDIFNGLAQANATILITGNWGISELTANDRAIAINKGWTITG